MSMIKKYNVRAEKVNSLVCVGLDSEYEKIPASADSSGVAKQFDFNKQIIDQTHEYVASYKMNIAFYEARGDQGLRELKMTMDYLRERHPDIYTICDAKRADIGNTNRGYVAEIFDWLGFDAVTLHPYLGSEAMMPFLERHDKGCIILCRTSNPGAGELQDLIADGKPLWQHVAEKVRDSWNARNNCMLVVGATYPDEMKEIRSLVGDMTFLVPGIGAQGGDLEATMKAGLSSNKKGLIIHSARGIIFAENPAKEAKKLRDDINQYR